MRMPDKSHLSNDVSSSEIFSFSCSKEGTSYYYVTGLEKKVTFWKVKERTADIC
jgi:hypothetical protein